MEGLVVTLHWWIGFTPNSTAVFSPWGWVKPLTAPPSKSLASGSWQCLRPGQNKWWGVSVSVGGRGSAGPRFKSLATFQGLLHPWKFTMGWKGHWQNKWLLDTLGEGLSWRQTVRWRSGVEQVHCVAIWTGSGGRSHQDVLAPMKRLCASSSCSLPSIRLFLPATAQVFGHIPAMHTAAQPIQRGLAIGLLQRYLIGLIWAQERHSYKICFLIAPKRQRSLHLLAFCGVKWLRNWHHTTE